MPFKSVELESELVPLPLEGTPPYRRLLASIYASTWRAHPASWEMHVRNKQFVKVENVNGIPATKHCVAQALRADVIAWLIGLRWTSRWELAEGVLLTDSYKAEERRYMLRVGPSWNSYAYAQQLAKQSWVESRMFGERVIQIASSVAHETLTWIAGICEKTLDDLTEFEIAQLIAHYVDDISRNHDWVEQASADGNMLDIRMRHNASNPAYAQLNEEGQRRLREEAISAGVAHLFPGTETTYEAQARIGHMVEDVLAQLMTLRIKRIFEPRDLPVITDNVIRQRFNDRLAH